MDLLDSFSSSQDVMEANRLKLWSKISPRDLPESSQFGTQNKVFDESPFPCDDAINGKIALWVGDISALTCHAIVNTTNETFNDRSPIFTRIMTKGGPQLRHHIKDHVRGCRTGDAKITKGYQLPARFVIHTVGPKYNQKYHTAAESALFSCYSKVLQLAREQNIKTLGLCAINSIRRGYPPHEGAHIALRVVRRFIEKYGDDFEVIVFAVEDVDVGIYELLMPLYFPRSKREEEYAEYCLPKDIGGQSGEPVILDRKIRIADKPIVTHKEEFEDTVDLTTGLESSVIVGKSSFAKMQGDVDKRWQGSKPVRMLADPLTTEIQRRNRYERLLRKSKTEDLNSLAALRFLYITGEDRFGRPVVVIIGQRFKFSSIDEEKALMYIVATLDSIVQKEYVVIYFHTLTTKEHHPSLAFAKYAFETLEYKYKKNLKAMYIVHPLLWTRVLTWWFTTFSAASSIKKKVYFLGGVEYLNHVIPLDQLQVPTFIMDYDFKVNGVRYYGTEAVENGNI